MGGIVTITIDPMAFANREGCVGELVNDCGRAGYTFSCPLDTIEEQADEFDVMARIVHDRPRDVVHDLCHRALNAGFLSFDLSTRA